MVQDSNGNTETYQTTEEHPFWVVSAGWLPAKMLQAGMTLVNRDNEQTLKVVSQTKLDKTDTVYNFEVDEFHTYHIGEFGVWVHNDCFSAKEQKIADYLKRFGRKVEPNPNEGVVGAGRQGDAIVDGIITEFKSLDSGATANTIKNTVNNSIRRGGQARDIVIDARGSGLSQAEAQLGLNKAWGIRRDKLDHITIIGDNFFVIKGN